MSGESPLRWARASEQLRLGCVAFSLDIDNAFRLGFQKTFRLHSPTWMLAQVHAADYRIRGLSLGGIYTSVHVPELSALFDVGFAIRSAAAVRYLFLSHGHVDHCGALPTLLGIRALVGKNQRLRVFLPHQMVDHLQAALESMSQMQRWPLDIDCVPMADGDTAELKGDLLVRAFRTHHPVPSLGYTIYRRVRKLRAEFADLPGREIGRLRTSGADIFDVIERRELAYATDTLIGVLDTQPDLLSTRVLLLECTFLDGRKSLEATHAGCHIHLDEIIERAELFRNDVIVLTHFSQMYKPAEVVKLLDERCPPSLRERIVPLIPKRHDWPG